MASLRKSCQRAEALSELVLSAVHAALARCSESDKLAIAFSGGLDSTVLLHAVAASVGAARCVALHIHHGLSKQADAWLAHCTATAQALGVTFASRCVQVQAIAERGLEAAARDVRYAALNELCQVQATPLLLLAHHADDQAETVLLQLLRGAGPAGLAAMPLQSHKVQGEVQRLRPLLAVPRAALEAYAAQHALRWVDDESNQDPRYVRNALRHTILPVLERHFPAYRKALARTARHAAEAQQLLDELAALDLPSLLHPNPTQATGLSRLLSKPHSGDIPHQSTLVLASKEFLATEFRKRSSAYTLAWPAVRKLLSKHPPRAANLIRYWMRQLNVPTASSAWLDDLLRQLQYQRVGQTLRVDHAGYRLCAYREQIWWETATSSLATPVALSAVQHDQLSRMYAPSEHALNPSELLWAGETSWHLAQWKGTLLFVPVKDDSSASVSAALLRSAPLSAHVRQGGERMRQTRGGRNRTLKNLFQETGIPVWQRNVPLIYVGQTLLFVPRLGLNQAQESVADINSTSRFCLVWQEDT